MDACADTPENEAGEVSYHHAPNDCLTVRALFGADVKGPQVSLDFTGAHTALMLPLVLGRYRHDPHFGYTLGELVARSSSEPMYRWSRNGTPVDIPLFLDFTGYVHVSTHIHPPFFLCTASARSPSPAPEWWSEHFNILHFPALCGLPRGYACSLLFCV
jgi:hypothetical protein